MAKPPAPPEETLISDQTSGYRLFEKKAPLSGKRQRRFFSLILFLYYYSSRYSSVKINPMQAINKPKERLRPMIMPFSDRSS